MRPPPFPIRRVVIVVPSLFTLFNLFFGIWSMVLATRAEFYRAAWFIVFAGILDTLDGRVARISGTGTRFGAELDSLVDIVSFGVAPAFLMYQVEFAGAGSAAWIFCYFYVMAAAIRLARFNVTQAGRAKSYFIGLPSPAAGMTVATFYPFTQTELLGLLLIVVNLVAGIWQHDVFLFPLGIVYMSYGVVRAVLLGFFKAPAEDEEAEIAGPIVIDESNQAYGAGPRRGPGAA